MPSDMSSLGIKFVQNSYCVMGGGNRVYCKAVFGWHVKISLSSNDNQNLLDGLI